MCVSFSKVSSHFISLQGEALTPYQEGQNYKRDKKEKRKDGRKGGKDGGRENKVYHKSMTLKEAIKSSLIILKQVMEEKLNATNIELATVQPGQNFHMFTKEELEEVIKDI
uniref:Uncharacterized protein n=1 Tax=Sciurus vulgaris TaxID=55149 RepID=A0A8D2D224_SCIVU